MGAQRVLVIGAGAGGLAAAVLLASRGADVTVLEAASGPGGKLREVWVDGRPQDAGPTVFTMRWVFDQLFAEAGSTLAEHLQLQPLQLLARHAWGDDARLDLFADQRQSEDAIAAFAGAQEARRYRQFSLRARRIYEVLEQSFMAGPRPSPASLVRRVGWRGLPGLASIAPFSRMWSALGQYFHDPRLRQLFGRYATYCGSSPFLAPATLMLVAHAEQAGVWSVEGGMHRIATSLEALLLRHGGQVRYDSAVASIDVGAAGVQGVQLVSGETLAAQAVVFNGDSAALAQGLLGAGAKRAVPPVAPSSRSLSALTWNLVSPARGFPLARHTVFFSGNYQDEFDRILGAGQLPMDPTIYVCAHDRGATGSDAPTVAERLMCLVNAPPGADQRALTQSEVAQCQERVFDKLARFGLRLYPEGGHAVRTAPADFHRLFPATGGALYGRASHGWMASFSRPAARCAVPGLYLAGGSVHPGPGVPMAVLSGRQAARSLLEDRSRAAARGRR